MNGNTTAALGVALATCAFAISTLSFGSDAEVSQPLSTAMAERLKADSEKARSLGDLPTQMEVPDAYKSGPKAEVTENIVTESIQAITLIGQARTIGTIY